jgi:RNA polymerase sigma-70 factor (ECF subfamily)
MTQAPPSGEDALTLARAAADGDRGAVRTLLERYLPQVRAFVRLRAGPLVRAHESSSDLVQSVCREVLEHAGRFRHPSESAFRQWLLTTALRKIQNRREHWTAQKRDRGREVPLDSSSSEPGERDARLFQVYTRFASPSRQAIVREELERVEAAFDELAEEQREVVILAHVVGLSRAEIALRLGKSEGAVRVTLHRALARIAGLLEARRGSTP